MFAISTKFPGLCTQHPVVLMLTVDSTSVALRDLVKPSVGTDNKSHHPRHWEPNRPAPTYIFGMIM